MKFKLGGREFSFEIRKKKEEKEEVLVPARYLSDRVFSSYVEERMKVTGKTEAQIMEETFKDGWLVWMVEESGGSAQLEVSQLFKEDEKKKREKNDYTRLRKKFAPISNCVDYLMDQILGGGIGVIIDKPEDKNQQEIKKELEKLLEEIYQDEYFRDFRLLLPTLVDTALTTGCSAAEITYEKDKTFWDYATVMEEARTVQVEGKALEIVMYNVKEPEWNTDLQGIKRLKIMDRAYERFDVQRDPKSWEIKYWIVDEGKGVKPITLSSGIKVRKLAGKQIAGTYLHPWQVFWLVLRRKGFGVKGESVIEPVYSSAILLEKIMKAVGEGIHRAGNKKYFIICGTEKRPWSTPHIRNVLQQLKEASKKNWSTIPMPMGFDIKDIGGEVFEANDVVDYFLKIIAGGMKVPASVLGIEVREQKEYSYTGYKANLLSAVKHQLFKRHVWCKHGKKSTKQGGKAERTVYIPNPRIKVEELLTMRERIDLFIDMSNVANPVHGLVKLKGEQELCKLLGWDDVLLPTQEVAKKEMDERKAKEEAFMEKKSKIVDKVQGPPIPQTKERQVKRLEGMADKHPEKGKARELGKGRRSIEETIPSQSVDINLNINVDGKSQEVIQLERKLAEKQSRLVEIQTELAEKRKHLGRN